MKRSAKDDSEMYAGEHICNSIVKSTGSTCKRKAYYLVKGDLRCGTHAKPKSERKALKENPRKSELRAEALRKHVKSIEEAAIDNVANGGKGEIITQKLRMMKHPELIPGHLLVFPNYRHEKRKDGYGCSELSPMKLGPVHHGQKDLPPAKNIENFHQFNKVFPHEVDQDDAILEVFYTKRIEAYNDKVPHRHKYDRTFLKKQSATENANHPQFSVFIDADGEERRFTYLQSRYFYCHFYEILARDRPEFEKLKSLVNNGYNLCIVGYDAHKLHADGSYADYCDISKPFGHEMVLSAMLSIDDSNEYPWNVYYRNHKDVYGALPFDVE